MRFLYMIEVFDGKESRFVSVFPAKERMNSKEISQKLPPGYRVEKMLEQDMGRYKKERVDDLLDFLSNNSEPSGVNSLNFLLGLAFDLGSGK